MLCELIIWPSNFFNFLCRIPSHADFLIIQSTVPGFYSWRNTTTGGYFIQALVHVLQREAETTDLHSILNRVSRKVAYDFQSNVPGDHMMHEKKQIPCVMSMLTRDLVFTKKSLLPRGSPFGSPGPHGRLFHFLCPQGQRVPILLQGPLFHYFRLANVLKVRAATI